MRFVVKDELSRFDTGSIDIFAMVVLGRKLVKVIDKVIDKDNFKITVDLTQTDWDKDALEAFLKLVSQLKCVHRIVPEKTLIERYYPWIDLLSYHEEDVTTGDEAEVDDNLEEEFDETQQPF